jgi:recombination protein RecA
MAKYLRTGSLGADILLNGGWKPGTINEIWGEPGSGKTTLAEHAIWELPDDAKSLWMSLGQEHPHRSMGPQAMVCQPRNAEQAFTIMETCVLGDISLIVVDSANGLVRKRELDEDPDYVPDPHREYKNELNGLKQAVRAHGAIVLFLSKPRDRDRQPIRGTGISEKAKDRVRLKIVRQHQDEKREVEAWVHGKEDAGTVFTIEPGHGVDWAKELFHLGVRYHLIQSKGSWYEWKGVRVQGETQAACLLRDRPDLSIALDNDIRHLNGIGD